MISSVEDSVWESFGEPRCTKLYERLDAIGRQSLLMTAMESEVFHEERRANATRSLSVVSLSAR